LVDLVFLLLAVFDSSLLSCHFWPFSEVQNGKKCEVMLKVGGAGERPRITQMSPMGQTFKKKVIKAVEVLPIDP